MCLHRDSCPINSAFLPRYCYTYNVNKKQTLIQFLKYNAGGLLYFASAWCIITFGTASIGLWWANVIGNGVGILLNYLVQRFWTFNTSKKKLSGGWKYVLLTVVNLMLSYYILRLVTGWGVKLWLAQFVSAGFFTVWNWVWYKYWVFKEKSV